MLMVKAISCSFPFPIWLLSGENIKNLVRLGRNRRGDLLAETGLPASTSEPRVSSRVSRMRSSHCVAKLSVPITGDTLRQNLSPRKQEPLPPPQQLQAYNPLGASSPSKEKASLPQFSQQKPQRVSQDSFSHVFTSQPIPGACRMECADWLGLGHMTTPGGVTMLDFVWSHELWAGKFLPEEDLRPIPEVYGKSMPKQAKSTDV